MPKPTSQPTNPGAQYEPEPNTLVFEDKEYNYGFVILPKQVLFAQNLSAEAKLLYAHLLGYAYEKDHCFPGYGTLCADMGKSENTVRNFMRELEAVGLLEQKRRGLGRTNIYVLLSLSKAKLIILEHHDISRTANSEVQEPQKSQLLEQEILRSNNKKIEKEKDLRNVNHSNIRNAKSGFDYVKSTRAVERVRSDTAPHEETGEEQHQRRGRGRPRKQEGIVQTPRLVQHHRNIETPTAQQTSRPARARQESFSQFESVGDTLASRYNEYTPGNDDEAYDAIRDYIRDIAGKLHDEAPLKSSTTRAYKLYVQSGGDLNRFFNVLYDAEKEASRRSANIKKLTEQGLKNRMAYFFAVLEDLLGLRPQRQSDAS